MADKEPSELERLAALNASLRCEQHRCHPQVCGCPYDPITIEEAREIWAEDEAAGADAEEDQGQGLDYYISILAAVERQHKLHLYRLRSRQLVDQEMTGN
jgi:hypothetical protein